MAYAPAGYVPQMHTSPIHSTFDTADFHEQQRRHYGKREQKAQVTGVVEDTDKFMKSPPPPSSYTSPPPPPPSTNDRSKYSAANEKATRRKPVPTRDPKLGPPPPADKRPVSAEDIGLETPIWQPESVAAAGAERYIKTTPDGRFDPGTIRPGSAPRGRDAPPPPTSFDTPPPPTSFDAFPEIAGSLPPSSYGSKGEDASSHTRPSLTRSDSSRSLKDITKDIGAKIRRGSTELAENFGRVVSIASKPPTDRKRFEKNRCAEKRESARHRSAERESQCQDNPEMRPTHEVEGLRLKNFQLFEQERAEGKRFPNEPNPYAHKSQVLRDADRTARRQHRRFTNSQQGSSGGHPDEPASPAGSYNSSISLTPSERTYLREEGGIPHRKPSPPLDGWERAGMKLGHMIDPMRRKRSDESDFFTDAAVEGALFPCTKCGKTPESCLKGGVCEVCRDKSKEIEKVEKMLAKEGKRHQRS